MSEHIYRIMDDMLLADCTDSDDFDDTEEDERLSEESGEDFLENFGGDLSLPLARLFGLSDTLEVADNRSSMIHLAALCGIRAYQNGVRDFRVTAKMDDGDFHHVVLSYEKKEGDVSKGRATRVYILENIGRGSSDSAVEDKRRGQYRFKKYLDCYRKVKRGDMNVGSDGELESFTVCSNEGFQHGERIGHFVFDESILVNAGRDDLLMTDLVTFAEDFEGKRELVMFLKDFLDRPRDLKECVIGSSMSAPLDVDDEVMESSSKAAAEYFTNLIARNPDTKVLKIEENDSWVRKYVDSFSDNLLVKVVGGVAFNVEFCSGENMKGGLRAFRKFLNVGLESLGMSLDALLRYTIQLETVGCPEDAGTLEFLSKLKLYFTYPGHDAVHDSVNDEMAGCLHKLVKESATNEFMELVTGVINQGTHLTEAVIREFLDNFMLRYGALYVFRPVDTKLNFITKERDIMSTCFCESCRSGKTKRGCHDRKNEKDCPRFPDGEDIYTFLRNYFGFIHECLVRKFGRTALKTREMRMRLAHSMTVVGENESALELAEGEIRSFISDGASQTLSDGFDHVRGRALIGLGREEESVKHLVSSCIRPSPFNLEINDEAFRATINIVYDLVCRRKYEVAGRILEKLLSACVRTRRYLHGPLHTHGGLDYGGFQNFGARFHVGATCSRILAAAVYEWCNDEGGSKKEALEILKIIYQFFKSFLGEEDFDTLQVKFMFSKLYCERAKGPGLQKGLQYLMELHRSLCSEFIGNGSDNTHNMIHSLHVQIFSAGGNEVAMKVMREAYTCAKGKLGTGHPFTQKVLKDIQDLTVGYDLLLYFFQEIERQRLHMRI